LLTKTIPTNSLNENGENGTHNGRLVFQAAIFFCLFYLLIQTIETSNDTEGSTHHSNAIE